MQHRGRKHRDRKHLNKAGSGKNPEYLKVGDIVFLVDCQTPRDQWPLGVITRVVDGKDQLVRRVVIKMAKSEGLERHVAHIVLFPDEEAAEGASSLSMVAEDGLVALGNTNSLELRTPENTVVFTFLFRSYMFVT